MKPILELLNRLIDIHQRVLDRTQEKKLVLIEGNVARLNEIVQEESKWVKEIMALEKERLDQIQEWFAQNRHLFPQDSLPEQLRVTDLMERVEDPTLRQQLFDASEQLVSLIDEIQKANHLNQELIEQSLEYIEKSIEIITETPVPHATYQKPKLNQSDDGKTNRSANQRRILIRKFKRSAFDEIDLSRIRSWKKRFVCAANRFAYSKSQHRECEH